MRKYLLLMISMVAIVVIAGTVVSKDHHHHKGDDNRRSFYKDKLHHLHSDIEWIDEQMKDKKMDPSRKSLLEKIKKSDEDLIKICKKGLKLIDQKKHKELRELDDLIFIKELDQQVVRRKIDQIEMKRYLTELKKKVKSRNRVDQLIKEVESLHSKMIKKEEQRVEIMKDVILLNKKRDQLKKRIRLLELEVEKKEIEEDMN